MKKNNPLVIPRNHRVEEVLKSAENGDLKPFIKFLNVLIEPYNEHNDVSNYQSLSGYKENYQTFCGT